MNRKSKKIGFTLIEVLVSTSIIAILSGMVIANYLGGQKVYRASRAAQQFAADLREVQISAISGSVGETGATGFGIYIESPTEYVLFYNENDETVYDYSPMEEFSSRIIKRVTLGEKVHFAGPGDNPSNPDVGVTVYFKPPQPIHYINNCVSTCEHEFKLISEGVTQSVQVDVHGLIEINPKD